MTNLLNYYLTHVIIAINLDNNPYLKILQLATQYINAVIFLFSFIKAARNFSQSIFEKKSIPFVAKLHA